MVKRTLIHSAQGRNAAAFFLSVIPPILPILQQMAAACMRLKTNRNKFQFQTLAQHIVSLMPLIVLGPYLVT